jgi:serine phosphatase RsbU (regulator of sigma subunit)
MNSLHSIIKREGHSLHDTITVDYYVQLSNLAREDKRYDDAVLFCDTILKKYKHVGFDLIKKIEIRKAMHLKAAGKTDVAISQLLDVLAEYEDRKMYEESASLNNKIGIIFLKMSEFDNAEYHLNESILQARKINDYGMEATSLMSLGNRYKSVRDFKKAENYYKKSIQLCKEHDLKRTLAGNYNNYGSLLRLKSNLDRAVEYYKKAMAINLEIGNDRWLSYNYNNLGNVYKERGQYTEALKYFNLSNEIKERLDDTAGKVQTLLNLSTVYEAMGNTNQAYEYHKLYAALKDSLDQLNRLEISKEHAARFQTNRREAEIRELNMMDKLNKQELQSKDARNKYLNSLTWFFGVGILLILGIALILWKSVVNRKKINSELQTKNIQIDEKNTEIIDSINYAKRIQNTILPNEDVLQELLPKHALLYKPKDIISGDFYICEELKDNIFFGTVDCTGHGVPGAMVSIVASNSFSKTIHELGIMEPGSILNELNIDVPRKLDSKNQDVVDGMDMALCKLDKNRKVLSFSGAYQNCWVFNTKEEMIGRNLPQEGAVMHESADGMLLELKGTRRGIGMSSGKDKFDQFDLEYRVGDKVLLSTDGFQDQFGGIQNKKFKVKQMRDIVMDNMQSGPNEIMTALRKALGEWQGEEEQIDDICLLIVEL